MGRRAAPAYLPPPPSGASSSAEGGGRLDATRSGFGEVPPRDLTITADLKTWLRGMHHARTVWAGEPMAHHPARVSQRAPMRCLAAGAPPDQRSSGDVVEPQREVLRLNRNESAVLGELVRLEIGVPEQRLTRTYRRILELSRSNEPIDGILVAHLVREFLAAFAFSAMGNDLPKGRLDYRERVGELAMTWPGDVWGGVPPDLTIAEFRRLLNDHDATSARAGNLTGATFQRGDRVSRP